MSLLQVARPNYFSNEGGTSNHTQSSGTANAIWRFKADGILQYSGLFTPKVWLNPGQYGSQYWVRATLTIGSAGQFVQGTFNTWQQVNVDRTWDLQNTVMDTVRNASVSFQFAYNSAGTVLVPGSTATVDFTAQVGIPG